MQDFVFYMLTSDEQRELGKGGREGVEPEASI